MEPPAECEHARVVEPAWAHKGAPGRRWTARARAPARAPWGCRAAGRPPCARGPPPTLCTHTPAAQDLVLRCAVAQTYPCWWHSTTPVLHQPVCTMEHARSQHRVGGPLRQELTPQNGLETGTEPRLNIRVTCTRARRPQPRRTAAPARGAGPGAPAGHAPAPLPHSTPVLPTRPAPPALA